MATYNELTGTLSGSSELSAILSISTGYSDDEIDTMISNIADTYSSSSTYAVGDYVLYDSVLYRCTTAVTTAGTFDSDYWTQVTVGEEIDELKSTISEKADVIKTTANGSPCSISDGMDSAEISSLVVTMDYDSDGYTGVTVTHTANYLLDGVSFTDGYYYNDSGTATASTSTTYVTEYIEIDTSLTYIFTLGVTSSLKLRVHEYSSDKTWLRQAISVAASSTTVSYTPTSDATYIRLSLPIPCLSITMTTVDTYTTDWSSSVGTIYGGTFDLISGELVSAYDSDGTASETTYSLTGESITTYNGKNDFAISVGSDVAIAYYADTKGCIDAVADDVETIGVSYPNLIDNGYTILGDDSGFFYVDKSTDSNTGIVHGRMYYSSGSSSAKRTIQIAVDPNTTYVIKKDTATIMRVAVGDTDSPEAYSWLGSFDGHTSASSDALEVSTGIDDCYMYITLFLASDEFAYRTIDSNISSLTVTAKPAFVDKDIVTTQRKREMLSPYHFGTINQVARQGWRPTAAGTPPFHQIPSYELALKKGVKIMLADVRVTSDGEFICWHDDDLTSSYIKYSDGTALSDEDAAQLIEDLTLDELDVYDFGIAKGSQWAGTTVMRLADFLDWCAMTNCVPFLEVKVALSTTETSGMATLVKQAKLENNVIVCENYSVSTFDDLYTYLPNARFVVGGGTSDWDAALSQATALIELGAENVYITYTDPASITETMISAINAINVHLWYTEITSVSEAESFYTNGYFKYYTLISSAWVNILDEIYSLLIE